jgi:geranylgeranylglycerol-phosphate geranylgeranyltransferase
MFGFVVGFFLSGAANVSNDYFDLEVDRVNHPDRPLPSGRVTVRAIVVFTLFLSAIGSIAALTFGVVPFLLAITTLIIGQLYNWRIKEAGLLGNMTVSASVAMTFIFGGVAVGEGLNAMVWAFGAMAFVFDLAEEIASGAMDREGDEKRSKKSLASVRGKEFALNASVALFSLFMIMSFIPYIAGWLGMFYLILLVPTDALAVYFVVGLKRSDERSRGRSMLRGLYLTMTAFILLIVVSSML